MGDGRRKERVEREVQQIISTYLIQNLQAELGGLVTVTRVMMPADFRSARVFVSYFSQDNLKVDYLKILKHWTPDIQDNLNHKLQMRYVPKLTFMKDESTEAILKIERTLAEISPKATTSDSSGVSSDDSSGEPEN